MTVSLSSPANLFFPPTPPSRARPSDLYAAPLLKNVPRCFEISKWQCVIRLIFFSDIETFYSVSFSSNEEQVFKVQLNNKFLFFV